MRSQQEVTQVVGQLGVHGSPSSRIPKSSPTAAAGVRSSRKRPILSATNAAPSSQKQEVAPIVQQMESCKATCLTADASTRIGGFSEVFAFVCRFCGRGVSL